MLLGPSLLSGVSILRGVPIADNCDECPSNSTTPPCRAPPLRVLRCSNAASIKQNSFLLLGASAFRLVPIAADRVQVPLQLDDLSLQRVNAVHEEPEHEREEAQPKVPFGPEPRRLSVPDRFSRVVRANAPS